MDVRKTLLLHAGLQVLLWVAIVVVANHLSSAWFVRVDVTRDQRYTLAAVSRDAVARLDRPLLARVYYSRDLGPPYNNHRQALLEKLEELAAWSNGRMEVEQADPESSKDAAEEAAKLGIRPIPYRFKQGSRFEAREVYMGVVLMYGERTVPVDLLASIETMEYQLVKGLRTLTQTSKDRKVVGYTQGHGEIDLLRFPEDNPVGRLVADLGASYDLRAVALGGDDDVPSDVDLLVINGPEQPFSARAQYQVDQHLMAGRPALFLMRNLRPDFRTMRMLDVRHDLSALLGHYGVQLNKDVVVDRKSNEQFEVPVVKDGRMRRVMVDYPLIPRTRVLDRAHPVTRGVDLAIAPFTSSLRLADPLPTGVQGQVLVSSEAEAGRIQGVLYIQPDAFRVMAPGEEPGSFPLMVSVTGRLSSYFADKSIPPPAGRDPGDPSWDPDPASKIVDSAPTRLIVAGSADLLANNQTLVVNAVDWLVEDTALLDIRTTLSATEQFDPPEDAALQAWRAGVVGVPLLLLAIAGGAVALSTRRRA